MHKRTLVICILRFQHDFKQLLYGMKSAEAMAIFKQSRLLLTLIHWVDSWIYYDKKTSFNKPFVLRDDRRANVYQGSYALKHKFLKEISEVVLDYLQNEVLEDISSQSDVPRKLKQISICPLF